MPGQNALILRISGIYTNFLLRSPGGKIENGVQITLRIQAHRRPAPGH